MVGRDLLLKLRQLLDEIDHRALSEDSAMSALEVMWQIRTHKANQAEIPQAIFKVGDRLASVIYLEDISCWEVQLDGKQHQFDTFGQAVEFIENRRDPSRRYGRLSPEGIVGDRIIDTW